MSTKSKVYGKVVVTGGAGFIGSHLVDKLSEIGAEEIVVIDNLSNGRIDNLSRHIDAKYFSFVKADLKDPNGEWVNAFKDADVAFHFAANPEVRISSVDPRSHFNENIYATFNVLEASRKHNVKYHVFASSSTVYGEAKTIPTPEDYHPMEPISVYGATKLACEALYVSYAKLYGFKVLIARYANIIGPRSNHGVIIDFINKLKRNPKKLEILGDGTQRKSYLHVYDAIDATLHAFNYLIEKSASEYEVFNIGSEDWIRVVEIADIIVEEMGLGNVEYVFVKTTPDGRGWPGDVKIMLLDISKLKSIGWKPRWNSREAVRKTVRKLLGKE